MEKETRIGEKRRAKERKNIMDIVSKIMETIALIIAGINLTLIYSKPKQKERYDRMECRQTAILMICIVLLLRNQKTLKVGTKWDYKSAKM